MAAAILGTIEVQYADPADAPPGIVITQAPLITPVPEEVDFSDPASILQAVFDAAQSGDFSQLASLCDPMGENDEDTAAICEITANHPNKDLFIEFFAQGRINGEVTINGDMAELPFLFGPDGDQEETMNFILRDGHWYLLDF